MNPLLDKDFIYKLHQHPYREIYARIISLSFDERPLEKIEGRVTSGSINLDGDSALRRTCNLSLIAKDVSLTDFYWGLSNKFTLEIGLKNFIDENYPEIIWFKQGIYLITSFSSSLINNNYSISIGGKDKMCLLNGDVGGNLPASIDFAKIDNFNVFYSKVEFEDKTQYQANKYYIYQFNSVENKYEYVISKGEFNPDLTYFTRNILSEQKKITIKNIIQEAVHTYGKEMYHNIIINDLDDYGLELLEYRGDKTIYLLYDEKGQIYTQIVLNDNFKTGDYKISEIPDNKYNNAIDNFNSDRYKFYLDDKKEYSVTKISYGDVCGYRVTDLVYPGELISSVGESLTSVLDKIKNMLGPFEYFYDLEGRFVFQAKKFYSHTSWNSLTESDGDVFSRDSIEISPYSYSFENINLIQRFQNTPAINNLKNDYSVWGMRKTTSGAEIPIHARYAIHEKPIYYKNFEGEVFTSEKYDWRELIYQMAIDYYKHNQEEDFYQNIINNNRKENGFETYYPTGETGYEIFYSDLQGFWRELYNPNPELIYESSGGFYSEEKIYETDENGNKLPTYRIQQVWNPFEENLNSFKCDYFLKGEQEDENYSATRFWWNKNVLKAPELLNFWFDFFDAGYPLSQYSVNNIGDRSKVVNDTKITSIYFRKVPQVIFTTAEEYNPLNIRAGYVYVLFPPEMQDLFNIDARGKSAEEEIQKLFNEYSYCVENISITILPVYDLEPNTLIHLYNEENKINGQYQVKKITIPLTYNGTMTITANKAIEAIF